MPRHGDGLAATFREFVAALDAGDTRGVESFFVPGDQTLLVRHGTMVVGFADVVEAVRVEPLPAPGRLVQSHLREIGPEGTLVTAAYRPISGGQGVMTLLWQQIAEGWRISSAHLAVPGPAVDPAVWREAGAPLAPPLGNGPLTGMAVAAAENIRLGDRACSLGGFAEPLDPTPIEGTAPALASLQHAGAAVVGLARIGELGTDDTGRHPGGLPRNVRAPNRVPGGATCGPASAVAVGQADLGLGLDTAGSLLVPAAYQGLYGLRTTHGLVAAEGIALVAPSLDVVGWVGRDPELMERVAEVLLPERGRRRIDEVLVAPELLGLADPDVAGAVSQLVDRWDSGIAPLRMIHHDADLLADWAVACSEVRQLELADLCADWAEEQSVPPGSQVAAALRSGSAMDEAQRRRARRAQAAARAAVAELVGNGVLLLPTTATVAPSRASAPATGWQRTHRLLAVASIGGLPAVTLPLQTRHRLPCGAALVGPAGSDHALVGLARRLARAGGGPLA